jgi:hypothetical protein
MEGSVSIILAQPKGGKREFKFDSGAKLAKWCWENKINFFTDLKKTEQRD